MRTTKPITISLPTDMLRETERIAKEEVRTRTDVIRDALNQYVVSRRWQRLRQWGSQTSERLQRLYRRGSFWISFGEAFAAR